MLHSLTKSQSKQSRGSHRKLNKPILSLATHSVGPCVSSRKARSNWASKGQFDAKQSKLAASLVELSGSMTLAAFSVPYRLCWFLQARPVSPSQNTLHPSPPSSPRHLHRVESFSSGLCQASWPYSGPRYLSSSAASHRHTLWP